MFQKLRKAVSLGMALKKIRKGDSQRSKDFIQDLLANERGVFSKFVQYLGSKPEHALTGTLITSEPALDIDEVATIFYEVFSVEMSDEFIEIDDQPKCASIAQVHRVKDHNGNNFVVKVQYPFIADEIYKQLQLMNLMPTVIKFSPLKQWGVDIDGYRNYFKKMVDEELDYFNEIRNHERMQSNLANLSSVKIANIHPTYRSKSIFIQEYLNGVDLETFTKSANKQDKEFATYVLFESFLHQLFHHNFIQTDTNHGNFLFEQTENELSICLLDFGSCEELRENFVVGLYALIDAAINNKPINILGCFQLLGFDVDKLRHIEKQLPLVVIAFFKPLVKDFAFDLSKWNLDQELDGILGEYKWWFRTSGGTEFFAVMKAFSGLKNIFLKFRVNIFWKRLFLQSTKHMSSELSNLRIPNVDSSFSFDHLAKDLRISVVDNGREKVNLTMPASTVNDLENLISSDVLLKLTERGISIPEIIEKTKKSGCAPGDLFLLNDEHKSYRVWLE